MRREVAFRSFAEFLAERPPEGLGATLAQVTRLCADDPEALQLIEQAAKGSRGGDRRSEAFKVGNTNLESTAKNTAGYAVSRLEREYPDLHAQVLAKQISPHAAAVQAGFRPRTITVPLDPEKMARAIRRRLSDDELAVLIEALRY